MSEDLTGWVNGSPRMDDDHDAATPEKMLPYVRELARTLSAQIHAVLETPVTAEAVLNATALANGCYDQTWNAIQQLHPVPHACASGCVHCCYLPVEASAPTIFLVAAHLRAARTPLELKRLKQHLRHTVERIRGLTPIERVRADVPCALLRGGLCTVYSVRPLGCRSWNSRDASACAHIRADGDGDLRSVQDQRPFGITSGVHQGLTAALHGAVPRADSDAQYELNAALLLALELPDALQRWLGGEDPLVSARTGG